MKTIAFSCLLVNVLGFSTFPKAEEGQAVVIVGGGIAGAYAGYRLTSSGTFRPSDVMLVERTNRIGGRLFSPRMGCAGANASTDKGRLPRGELGGMRIRSSDKLVLGLSEALGVELGPFHMNKKPAPDGGKDEKTNPTWCRGLLATRQQYSELLAAGDKGLSLAEGCNATEGHKWGGVLPYALDAKSAAALSQIPTACAFTESHGIDACEESLERRRLNVDSQSASGYDYCNSAPFIAHATGPGGPSGYPRWQASRFTEQTHGAPSDEKYHLSRCFSGYGDGTLSWNTAVEGKFTVSGEHENVGYQRPLEGMEKIVHAAQEAFAGATQLNMELLTVDLADPSSSYPYLLTFGETRTSPCSRVTTLTGKTQAMRAARLILALPKAGLTRIRFTKSAASETPLELQATMDKLLNKISGEPIGKMNMVFSHRWWETALTSTLPASGDGFTVGRFTSSTPLTQVFAWYPGSQQEEQFTPAVCGSEGLMHAYFAGAGDPELTWGTNVHAMEWDMCNATTADGCDRCVDPSKFIGRSSNDVTTASWARVKAQLEMTFASTNVGETVTIPDPIEMNRIVWSAENPATKSDGIHHWLPGHTFWEVYPDVLEPAPKLHIIGEAFSLNSGWAEGAVETAEYMLHEKMGLPLPKWLKKNDYCAAMPYWKGRTAP